MAVGSSKIGSFVWLARSRHAQGLRYPTNVLLGTLILWVVLRGLGDRIRSGPSFPALWSLIGTYALPGLTAFRALPTP
jgi:hypothetical protein